MRSLPSLFLLLSLLLTGTALAQSGEPVTPDPRIAFDESAVVASGLTPGKPVAWFAVEHRIIRTRTEPITSFIRRCTRGTPRTPRSPASPTSSTPATAATCD
jgi:hypothetical protein